VKFEVLTVKNGWSLSEQMWATYCRFLPNATPTFPYFPQTGKSLTLNTFIPALIRTRGIVRRVPLKGAIDPSRALEPFDSAEPELPAPNMFFLNCLPFPRTAGLAGFLEALFR
jgi:hypothetical protein